MTQAMDIIKRNGRLAVLIGVVVILVVVAFVLYSSSQSSADQKAKLENQLTAAKVRLTATQSQYDLATLQTQLASLPGSSRFQSSFPTVALGTFIAGTADKYGVELVSVTPGGAVGTEVSGGVQCTRYATDVQVTGTTEAIDSFLGYLEHGPFLTLRLENVAVSPSGGTCTVVILTQS